MNPSKTQTPFPGFLPGLSEYYQNITKLMFEHRTKECRIVPVKRQGKVVGQKIILGGLWSFEKTHKGWKIQSKDLSSGQWVPFDVEQRGFETHQINMQVLPIKVSVANTLVANDFIHSIRNPFLTLHRVITEKQDRGVDMGEGSDVLGKRINFVSHQYTEKKLWDHIVSELSLSPPTDEELRKYRYRPYQHTSSEPLVLTEREEEIKHYDEKRSQFEAQLKIIHDVLMNKEKPKKSGLTRAEKIKRQFTKAFWSMCDKEEIKIIASLYWRQDISLSQFCTGLMMMSHLKEIAKHAPNMLPMLPMLRTSEWRWSKINKPQKLVDKLLDQLSPYDKNKNLEHEMSQELSKNIFGESYDLESFRKDLGSHLFDAPASISYFATKDLLAKNYAQLILDMELKKRDVPLMVRGRFLKNSFPSMGNSSNDFNDFASYAKHQWFLPKNWFEEYVTLIKQVVAWETRRGNYRQLLRENGSFSNAIRSIHQHMYDEKSREELFKHHPTHVLSVHHEWRTMMVQKQLEDIVSNHQEELTVKPTSSKRRI